MTDLIACLSTGKGTWANLKDLISGQKWEKVFLITNDFGKEKFAPDKNTELIVVDAMKQPMNELIDTIQKALKGKIKDTEVAVNLISGSGKEHMAILAAILKSGLSFRLVALTTDGVKEI